MFNKDFYPTPENVIQMMGIDCEGKNVLEPSAGKGDIVDYLNKAGAESVSACEMDNDLARIVKSKCLFINNDFLKVKENQISHIDMIVMNPPFSDAINHITHAYDIAPEGCEVISLINHSNYENPYSRSRSRLRGLIERYGDYEELGEVFKSADRVTGVNVGIIRIFKPNINPETEFNGFFEEEDIVNDKSGLVPYNVIQDIVSRYISSVKCFEKILKLGDELNVTQDIFKLSKFSVAISYDENISSKIEYKKMLQKKAWENVFLKLNINKYVTSGVMSDVNKFVEKQKNYPFSMKNIYVMIDIIVQNRSNLMDRSLVEVIDSFTKYTHENRYSLEGWKTNAGHLLNKKIIIPNIIDSGYGKITLSFYGRNVDKINDLSKVLCHLSGTDFNNTTPISEFFSRMNIETGKWYSWTFFDIKVFKKGTMHLKFQDVKDWEFLNRRYGEIKGQVLPEKI